MPLHIRVQEFREARHWSQAELARRAKVRPNTITEIEKGLTKRISLDVLERLADALGVDPGFLVSRVPAGKRLSPSKGRGK